MVYCYCLLLSPLIFTAFIQEKQRDSAMVNIKKSLSVKLLILAATTCLMLFACSAGPSYMGQPIIEKPFTVDGGKTIILPVTRSGAVPAENEKYKIENAGLIASVSKGSAHNSELTWAFSLLAKESDAFHSVVVEKITDNGGLDLMVKDDTPVLKHKNWYGKSASASMTKAACPWLYSSADEIFVFKFTIKDKDGSTIVMYQPSMISSRTKGLYLKMIYGQG